MVLCGPPALPDGIFSNIWIVHVSSCLDRSWLFLLQGICKDKVSVSYEHKYQQVELNRSVPGEIDGMLKTLRKALHEVNI